MNPITMLLMGRRKPYSPFKGQPAVSAAGLNTGSEKLPMFVKSLSGASVDHNDPFTRDCEDDPAAWFRRAHLAIAGDLRVDVDTKLDTFDLFNQAFCAADGNEPLQIAICKQYIERAERPR